MMAEMNLGAVVLRCVGFRVTKTCCVCNTPKIKLDRVVIATT